jgi:hypothetical protein
MHESKPRRFWSKLHAMTWRRLIASFLLLILPAGGIWVVVACDMDADETNDGSSTGDYCTIICQAQGHHCPAHDEQQHSTCNVSGGPETLVVVNALVSCIIQEPVRLHMTTESEPTSFVAPQTPASAMLEFPTPPPRASA